MELQKSLKITYIGAQKQKAAVPGPWVGSGPNLLCLRTSPMSGLSAMKSNLSTEKTPFPAINWYIEGGLLNNGSLKKSVTNENTPLLILICN